MSIYSLVKTEATRGAKRRSRPRSPGRLMGVTDSATGDAGKGSLSAGEVASTLARYVPSEAVIAYTTILGLITPTNAALDHQSYAGRWISAGAVAILAVLLAVGVYRRECVASGTRFSVPWSRACIVLVGFTGWLCVLPGTPIDSIDGHSPSTGLIIGVLINLLLVVAGVFLDVA